MCMTWFVNNIGHQNIHWFLRMLNIPGQVYWQLFAMLRFVVNITEVFSKSVLRVENIWQNIGPMLSKPLKYMEIAPGTNA